jgi:serine/threonine-protein kinase HipA
MQVLLHNVSIGTLTLLPNDQILFSFNASYIENTERPTLSLSYKNASENLISKMQTPRMRLPYFFSNVLPEGHLRNYLAHMAGVHPHREFFLLAALGQDLPGAVTVIPDEKIPGSKTSNARNKPQDIDENAFRFSLAGIQLKFSALLERTGGLTIPAHGVGGDWIIKLPSAQFKQVPENEYAMMTFAKLLGMNIPDVQLVPIQDIQNLPSIVSSFSDNYALAIRRFDRTPTGPIHIEDFAQVFSIYPEKKYDHANYKNMAEVIWKEAGAPDIIEWIQRLVFNTLIGNADMHLKNWSLYYPDRIHARLAPGYDFLSTILYIDDPNMALNYVKTKKRSDLSLSQLRYLANKAGIPEHIILDAAIDLVIRFKEKWAQEIPHLLLSREAREKIQAHWQTIPIVSQV